jgi:hypothetical protein
MVEEIEVEVKIEVKVEVEVGKVEGKWRTKDCYQYNKALGSKEVLVLPDVKTVAD